MSVVVRIPPSPTGNLHIGTARTALFNYLFAKKHGGKVFLRIEDTDRARSKPEFEQNIIDGLTWLGIACDNSTPIRQSERTELYQHALEQLIAAGAAYVAEDGVIRFKNPKVPVTFTDVIRGQITFDTTELGDFVIAKSLTTPLYHLAVVVDDLEMGVTHVIRGEDHISNTPRQILLIQALGGEVPQYAHIPLILAPDRSKLSKRHGATALTDYRAEGYLPEAVCNFIALLGWSPQAGGSNDELFSLAELVERFELTQVQSAGAVFNIDKLNWFNREYIKKLSPAELLKNAEEYMPEQVRALPGYNAKTLQNILPELAGRINTFGDIKRMGERGELDWLFTRPAPSAELLKTTKHLPKVIEIISALAGTDFTAEKIKSALWDHATEQGRGDVLWPMRVALTGLKQSPDPFTVAAALGKKETITRLENAAGQ